MTQTRVLPAPPAPSLLRQRRLALNLRQVDLADLAGLSRVQIVRLEAGESAPGLRTAQRLAAALRCTPEELFPADASETTIKELR